MASAPSPDTVRGLAPVAGRAAEVASATEPLPVGATLAEGRYQVAEPLGRGGFGVTYAATDTRLQRPVAIKELLPEGATRSGTTVEVPATAEASFVAARTRFLREATTLARFGHPNIVRIFATFEENGTAYLVLERVVGRSLAHELRARRGPLTEAEALEVAGHVAAALSAVHRAGVLHRDVSPANLIRTEDGRTVLIDFGLARPFVEDRTTMMTRIVTPGYAPPEQHVGAGRFSARADVYALGATLHRLLSGESPPVASQRRPDDELTPLWRRNPTVSRRTSDAVAEALALDPGARPASVTDLLDRLGVDRTGLDLVAPVEAAADEASATDDEVPLTVLAPGDDPDPGPAPEVLTEALPARPPAPPVPAAGPFGAEVATTVAPPDARPPVTAGPAPQAPAQWVVPAPTSHEAPVEVPAAPRRWRGRRAPEAQPVVGTPAGRRWVTWPLGLAAVGLASAQPVTLTLLLGLGVAPVVATVGDVLSRTDRSPAWAPLWWLRNVAVGAVRSLGALLVLAVGLCLWFGTDAFDALAPAAPWVLRITGVVTGALLATSIARGGEGFRSDVAVDALARRIMPRGTLTIAAVVVALLGVAVAAAGFAFQPEAYPLG